MEHYLAIKDSYPTIQRKRLAQDQILLIVKLFALDLTATLAASISNLNRNTINRYDTLFRNLIYEDCLKQSPLSGTIEVDESYFGPKRVRGKRGLGAGQKTIVFGILKRDGMVFTEIVPDCRRATLQGIIRGNVSLDSVIHSDGWRGYDGLVDVGYEKHLRVNHDANEFATGHSHINGIEGFWGFAKARLSKFRGVSKEKFPLHLKECEFRFNFRGQNGKKIENRISLLLKQKGLI